ncbi:hypothetical protein ACRRTK_008273 [Alexandromys fortis]
MQVLKRPGLQDCNRRIANLCCAACFSRPAAARARVSEPWSQNAVSALQKGLLQVYNSLVNAIAEGSQGSSSRQEPSSCNGVRMVRMLTGLLPTACSTCFRI